MFKNIRCIIDQKLSLHDFLDAKYKYGNPCKCQCCGKYSLGDFWICNNCDWQQDFILDTDEEYSFANYCSIKEAKIKYENN